VTDEVRASILSDPPFGQFHTDHMVSIDYVDGKGWHNARVIPYGPIELDQRTRRVTVNKTAVLLSRTEFRLLEYLLLHAEQPVSRDDLAQHVWDASEQAGSNVIDVYISYLRKRLAPAASWIRTVRGVGYTITRGRRSR